jgi:peptidoglycan/LPS O-acetylase OafA/YrhL
MVASSPGRLIPDAARDPQLDGVRGLGAIFVIFFHATYFEGPQSALGRVALTLPGMCFTMVDLFFVLSGFLITRILIKNRESPTYYSAFYGRRFIRIIPLYYVLLTICFVVVPMFDTGPWNDFWGRRGNPIWYWVFLSNWMNAYDGFFRHFFLTVSWTLAIEEQFYLVWPFLIRNVSLRTMERLCLVLVATAFVVRTVSILNGVNSVAVYTATPMRMDGLAWGAYMALRSQREGGFHNMVGAARRAWLPCVIGGFWIGIVCQIYPDWLMPQRGKFMMNPVMQTVGYTLMTAADACLICILMHQPPQARLRGFFSSRPLVLLGQYSYAMYLFHVPFITLFTFAVQSPADPNHPYWLLQINRYVAATLLSVGVGAISWYAFESPIMRLRRYFPYRKPERPEPAPALASEAPDEPRSAPAEGR